MPDTPVDALAARLLALSPDRRRLLLARLVPGGRALAGAGPVPVPRGGAPLPASFIQERLWLADQLMPATSAYVSWLALRLTGPLRVDLLIRAFDAVIRRHEILRTTLRRQDGRLVQVVGDRVPVPLKVLDVRAAADPWQAGERLLRGAAGTAFDLSGPPPLLRIRLARLADEDHLLGIYLHHAVTDGWSNGVLLRELGAGYRRALDGGPEPLPLSLQYADVAVWQRTELTGVRLDELLGYWSDQLDGVSGEPVLPVDRPRRADVPPGGGRQPVTVPAVVADRLRRLARAERATVFMVVLAGLAAVLARWTGRPDVVIGNAQGGRTHPDLEDVIGPLVNTVVLRLRLDGAPTGRQLLRQARQVALDAQAHADLPFERLVEHLAPRRAATHHPLFEVNLGVGNLPEARLDLPGMSVRQVQVTDDRVAKFDLSCYLSDDGASGGWSGTLEYHAGRFTAGTMDRLAGGLRALLAGLADDPDRPVADLPVGELRTRHRPTTEAPATARRDGAARHVPPRDRWEHDVARVWAQVLDVDRVGATSDFFELGGHSMAAMLVVERLRQLTDRRISLATLFQRPTVEGLASALRGAGATDAPFVVALDPTGSGPPLFFIHSAVGELTMYFPLAHALAGSRPLYGVQPDGFFRAADPGDLTLEQLAARYAEEIVRVHPDGPSHLCGFSAAGRLAVAVADRLVGAGRPVGAVLLLDSAPYGDVAPDPDLATVLARWLPFAPPAAELAGLDRDGVLAAVLAAGNRAGAVPPGLDGAEFARWCRRIELGARALAGHGPLRYPGPVTLLMWAGRTGRDIVAEWASLPVRELRVEPVEVATHESFVMGESVPAVAARMVAHLERADREWRQP